LKIGKSDGLYYAQVMIICRYLWCKNNDHVDSWIWLPGIV